MKKKIALLLCAAMVLALTACGDKDKGNTSNPTPITVTATPTPGQKNSVTATPTVTPTPVKDWKLEPTWTPKPTPTLTPEQLAAKEAEEAAKLAASKFSKTYPLDFSKVVSIIGDAPAVSDDGVAIQGQKTQKFCIPMGVIVKKDRSALVTVTLQFNSSADTAIRVYGIQGTADSAKTTIGYINNPGNTKEFTATAVITANEDYDTLLVASSGWGTTIDNVVIKKITVAPNPDLDLATVTQINGDLPAFDGNGGLVAKGGRTQKFAFPLSDTYNKGDVLAVTLTAKFNSASDTAIRLYTIADMADSAHSDIIFINNPGNTNPVTKTVLITVNDASNGLLVASSGWGQSLNDVALKAISVKKAEVLDLTKVFSIGGELPAVQDDGSLVVKGGVTQKFAVPAETTDLTKGSKVTAAITIKFNSADDASVRLYPILGSADSALATPVFFNNPGNTNEVTIPVEFEVTKNADTILLGGSGWGVSLNDVVIKRVVLYETPVLDTATSDTTPKTGDTSTMIMIVLLGMAAVSGVVFFKKREEVR